FVNRDLEHFRYRWERFARVHFETFVQRDRDPFRRLVLRTLGGAGPRFLLATTGATVTALGVAYMLEYERLSAGDFPDSAEEQLAHRLSAYAVVTVKLNELLSFGETLFAQPRFGRPRDYRLLSETQWVVAVNKSVSLKAALSMAYDNRPPASRRPLDTATRMSVQLKF
ncbi:MAG TPA: DUF481 domain-containing protein, partial [Myxococcaceae bacterium]|nr:DUF481 domain-containing protein [Myxococcaceae bacterium]